MRKVKYFVLVLTLLFISCRSAELFRDTEYMHIMVYDLANNPIQGMKFYMDGKEIGETDVYGRLSMSIGLKVDSEVHTITGQKEAYLGIEEKIVKKAGGVLYFKSGTVQMYLSSAESAIDRAQYNQALSYLDSIQSMDKGEDVLFLKAIVLKRLGKSEDYEALMKELGNKKIIREILGDSF